MKILFVCHRFPYPPKRGGKIRPFNIVSHLHRSHEVTVASLVRSEDEAREGQGLSDHCHKYISGYIGKAYAAARMVGCLATRTPSSMGYFWSPELARKIRHELATRSFDLIFVDCSSAGQYVDDVTGIPRIIDFVDMDSQKWLEYAKVRAFPLSLGYLIEGKKMEAAEAELARRFDLCACATSAEMETLMALEPSAKGGWFPNGVDSEYFSPSSTPFDPDQISFIGRMDYYPNQQCVINFCRTTLPLIQRKRPATKFVIIGADPPRSIRNLGSIPGVTVTGSVPDVRPFVRGSAVSIANLEIARGTQNKILESLAMGVPVVSSQLAAGGIDAVPGTHFLVASTPDEYAEAVLRLLDNPDERRRFSEAGRSRMLTHHSWSSSMQRCEALIERLCPATATRAC